MLQFSGMYALHGINYACLSICDSQTILVLQVFLSTLSDDTDLLSLMVSAGLCFVIEAATGAGICY